MSVATTYAEALYEAAADGDAVAAVAADVAAFAEVVEGSAELRAVLEDPEVHADQKKRAVVALVEGANPLVVNFLQVLLDRGRIEDFPDIARAFQERVYRAQSRLEVRAITAVPLPDDLRARMVKRIEEKTGNAVNLTESVNPDVVGGLVLHIGGVVVDGSVRHRIDELRETLRHTPVNAATAAS